MEAGSVGSGQGRDHRAEEEEDRPPGRDKIPARKSYHTQKSNPPKEPGSLMNLHHRCFFPDSLPRGSLKGPWPTTDSRARVSATSKGATQSHDPLTIRAAKAPSKPLA